VLGELRQYTLKDYHKAFDDGLKKAIDVLEKWKDLDTDGRLYMADFMKRVLPVSDEGEQETMNNAI